MDHEAEATRGATPYGSAAEHRADEYAAVDLALEIALRRSVLASEFGDRDEVANRHRAALHLRRAAIAARLAISDPARVPFLLLRTRLGVDEHEFAVLWLLVALEMELPVRRRAQALLAGRDASAPDLALVLEVIATHEGGMSALEFTTDGTLVRRALVQVLDEDQPIIVRRVRATERVRRLAYGHDTIGRGEEVLDREVARVTELFAAPPRDELILPAAYAELAALVGVACARGRNGAAHPVLLLSGPDGAGRKTLLATAAAAHGLATLCINAAALPRSERELRTLGPALVREALLANAVVVIDGLDRGPPHPALDDALLPDFAGPIAATVGTLTGRPPVLARGHVVIDVAAPSEGDRELLWHLALRETDAALATWAAERYVITPGVLERAATAALTKASARAGAAAARLDAADLHDGVRSVLDAKLATLGTRITWRQTWDDLVLPEDATLEIREFIARVRHRRQVFEHWGFGRKVAKGLGLSALFAGPPGTGKTMVAGLIACELGLDLYQIDLSKVVSKWVGETEKNLGELFDAAEAGHAILLFDEADSLFAKRTAVQSSNDRYANLEVNYLLQRMESFAGIVILTTNHDTAIDEAFRRRLSLRIEFPVPDVDERAHLWRALLPAEAEVSADVDFRALAERFEMTGGYIKNAILRAAFLAVDEGSAIAMRHLARAARSEYQAMGKVIAHL